MNFIYKIKHKKSGLYLKLDNVLDDVGTLYPYYPQNLKLSITVYLGTGYEPDSFETKTEDWVIEQFACILHDCHEPASLDGPSDEFLYNYKSFGLGGMATIPRLKINTPVVITVT
jgi:hypothetical protein